MAKTKTGNSSFISGRRYADPTTYEWCGQQDYEDGPDMPCPPTKGGPAEVKANARARQRLAPMIKPVAQE